jgi:DNA-binding transcriptional regulator YhcF (GntR family)
MSEHDAIDKPAIRRAIKTYVQDRPADTVEVISEVAALQDCPERTVQEVFDEMERNGFLYTVGDGDSAEVRLP